MTIPDYSIEIVKEPRGLAALIDRLCSVPVIAVDIETINWWNRHRERVALIQIAYRSAGGGVRVAVIDALARFDIDSLRRPLELGSTTKAVHNAAFDATRLARHFDFDVSPVYDTMAAARRSGERKYSLKAQAQIHLNLHLDKSSQQSDWSRRPLDARQLRYAALDAFATLLLYEHQRKRKLNGDFKAGGAADTRQATLPLESYVNDESEPDVLPTAAAEKEENIRGASAVVTASVAGKESSTSDELPAAEIALLGIIAELPTRYHPEGLAASVAAKERVGLAGWIIDRTLGADADLDEDAVKLAIADLCERRMIGVTETGRLEATETGGRLWRHIKPA